MKKGRAVSFGGRKSVPKRAELPDKKFEITEREKYLLKVVARMLAHELMYVNAFTKTIEQAEQEVVDRLSQEIERYTTGVPQ